MLVEAPTPCEYPVAILVPGRVAISSLPHCGSLHTTHSYLLRSVYLALDTALLVRQVKVKVNVDLYSALS